MVTEEQKPICQTYNRSVPAKGGNMSNLMVYLKEHYPELHAEAILSQQSSKDGTSGTKNSVKVTKPAEASSSTPKQPTKIDIVECLRNTILVQLKG